MLQDDDVGGEDDDEDDCCCCCSNPNTALIIPYHPFCAHTHTMQEEDLPDPLKDALEAAEELSSINPTGAVEAFQRVLHDTRGDEAAQRIKEESIYR